MLLPLLPPLLILTTLSTVTASTKIALQTLLFLSEPYEDSQINAVDITAISGYSHAVYMTGTDGGPCGNITRTTRKGQTWEWEWDVLSGIAEYIEPRDFGGDGVVNCYPENSRGKIPIFTYVPTSGLDRRARID
jgi:hypothetical protein